MRAKVRKTKQSRVRTQSREKRKSASSRTGARLAPNSIQRQRTKRTSFTSVPLSLITQEIDNKLLRIRLIIEDEAVYIWGYEKRTGTLYLLSRIERDS